MLSLLDFNILKLLLNEKKSWIFAHIIELSACQLINYRFDNLAKTTYFYSPRSKVQIFG